MSTATDLAKSETADAELEVHGALLQTVIDSVSDLIFVKDRQGRFILANKALSEGCGIFPGSRTSDVFDNSLSSGFEGDDADVIHAGEPRTIDEIVPIRGVDRYFQTVKVPWLSNGVIRGVIGVSRDLTESKMTEAALRASEAVNRTIAEASGDCIKLLSPDGRIIFVNAAGAQALEIEDPSAVIGRDWAQTWPAESQLEARIALETARRGMDAYFSAPRKGARGTTKWWDVVISPVMGPSQTSPKLVVIGRDVTEQKRFVDELKWSAAHDSLTGLFNRQYFQSRLSELCRAEERKSFAVILFDLDRFKDVNDGYGHAAGDFLLQGVAERLKRCLKVKDILARLGGDEFAIIVPECSRAEASLIGTQLIDEIGSTFEYEGHTLDCTTSIGIGLYPTHGTTPDALLRSADLALYSAKASGRSISRLYDGELGNKEQKRTSMLALGRDALARNAIIPFYQPKVNLVDGTLAGFEALLRWHYPGARIQTPSAIAPCFDHLQIGAELTRRMLVGIIADVRDWLDHGLDFGSVALNASSADFYQSGFADWILEQLRQFAIPTSHFQLEVTETVFLGRGAERVGDALQQLSKEGVRIALDDFGTGYASLRHLRQFPVDTIKIDGSFVKDIDLKNDANEIVRAVINLARSLRMCVVAEGIETREQESRLKVMDCDQGQGFLYSPAVPASAVRKSLTKR